MLMISEAVLRWGRKNMLFLTCAGGLHQCRCDRYLCHFML